MLANVFHLPSGMISPTMHNITTITGLLVDGDEVRYLHDVLGTNLGFQVNKKNNAYSTFINTENGLLGEVEHKAFLLF